MIKNILLVILIATTCTSYGQVKIFEPNLISNNDVFGLTISPDGKEMFFVKAFGGRDTLQIYYAKKVTGSWQKPELAPFADKNFKQIDPAFSPDGNSVLFNSLNSAENNFDIYVSNKTPNGWTMPERLPKAINTTASDFYATISNKKNTYFTRRVKSNDIYVSYFIDNKYQQAVLLDSTINTDKSESNPYISPNEDFIIFFGEYEGGQGQTDLYISFNKENKWSYPISLGNEINTKIGEFCPSIDFKNNLFLFARTELVNNKRVENIYTYPLSKLKLKSLKKLAIWKP